MKNFVDQVSQTMKSQQKLFKNAQYSSSESYFSGKEKTLVQHFSCQLSYKVPTT